MHHTMGNLAATIASFSFFAAIIHHFSIISYLQAHKKIFVVKITLAITYMHANMCISRLTVVSCEAKKKQSESPKQNAQRTIVSFTRAIFF